MRMEVEVDEDEDEDGMDGGEMEYSRRGQGRQTVANARERTL